MSEEKGPITQTEDSRITNTGTLVQVRLGEEEKRALRWLQPLLIFTGFNLAVSILLLIVWHNADTSALLVYAHQVKCEAQWEARGYDPADHCGPRITKK